MPATRLALTHEKLKPYTLFYDQILLSVSSAPGTNMWWVKTLHPLKRSAPLLLISRWGDEPNVCVKFVRETNRAVFERIHSLKTNLLNPYYFRRPFFFRTNIFLGSSSLVQFSPLIHSMSHVGKLPNISCSSRLLTKRSVERLKRRKKWWFGDYFFADRLRTLAPF